MADERQDIFTRYIVYNPSDEGPGSSNDIDGVPTVRDYEAVQRIADQHFEMNKRELGKVLSNQDFSVPEYQRLFSWRTRHHRQLWADIHEIADAEFTGGSHDASDVFFSTMYFAADQASQTYEIIDGQQRLTSIHVLFRVILEELERLNDTGEFENRDIAQLCERSIQQIKTILYDPKVVRTDEPRLSLNKHDDAFFNALIRGPRAQLEYLCSENRPRIDGRRGDATRVEDVIEEFDIDQEIIEQEYPDRQNFRKFIPVYSSHWRLLRAYQFYREQVRSLIEQRDKPEAQALALLNLSNYIQRSFYVGEFVIREAEPNFRMQIFEILNDRGIELTKIDRIRATVVNAFFDEDDKERYVGRWEDIVVAFGTDSDKIDDYLSVYLSIVDDEIETVGDASGELTNAFATQNIDTDVKPRFNDLNVAREFLEDAHEYVGYYEDITSARIKHETLEDVKDVCEEILVRLNRLQTEQWHPLVLRLYRHAATNGETISFEETLDTIEKLNLRRLLVDVNPNVFQTIFIEAVHEFQNAVDSAEMADPYAHVRQYLIDEMESIAPEIFGERFLDTLTQQQSWNPSHTKLVFGKMANDWFRENGYAVDRTLNMANIHLEHILPQSLVHDSSDPIWLPQFFQVEGSNDEMANKIQRYLDSLETPDEQLTPEEKQWKSSMENFITNRFVEDIGNYLLLSDGDNIRASDHPLSKKLPQYFNNEKDFTIIWPNVYFTRENPTLDEQRLDALLDQVEAVDEGELDRIDTDIAEYFDSFWTYEKMQERRVELLLNVVQTLSFEEVDDEFGLEEECATVREQVRTQTEEEFEKRLSLRTV